MIERTAKVKSNIALHIRLLASISLSAELLFQHLKKQEGLPQPSQAFIWSFSSPKKLDFSEVFFYTAPFITENRLDKFI